jgi:hypothetical protein
MLVRRILGADVALGDTRIVDQNIDTTVFFDDLGRRLVDVFRLGDIERYAARLQAELFQSPSGPAFPVRQRST